MTLVNYASGSESASMQLGDADNALQTTALVISGVNALSAAMDKPVEFANTPDELAAFAKFFLGFKADSNVAVVGQVRIGCGRCAVALGVL